MPATNTPALAYNVHASGSGWGDSLPGPSVAGGTSHQYPRLALGADGSGVLAWAATAPVNGTSRRLIHGSAYTSAGGFSAPRALQREVSATSMENSARVAALRLTGPTASRAP